MKRFILTSFASLVGLGVLAVGPAAAQTTFPYRAPAYGVGFQAPLSPYFNLLRGGDPSANYFLGTVPEFQRRQDRKVFSAGLADLDRREAEDARELRVEEELMPRLPATGHPTGFGNTGSYFSQPGLYSGVRTPVRSTYRRR